jgi:hypothetical protein
MTRDYTLRPTRLEAPGDGWASPQPTDIPSPRPMYPTRRMGKTQLGGGSMRAKISRILLSGATLASLLMAAGAKWKV